MASWCQLKMGPSLCAVGLVFKSINRIVKSENGLVPVEKFCFEDLLPYNDHQKPEINRHV